MDESRYTYEATRRLPHQFAHCVIALPGRRVLSVCGGEHAVLQVWDQTGCVRTLVHEGGADRAVALPGDRVAVGGGTHMGDVCPLRIWNLSEGRPVLTLAEDRLFSCFVALREDRLVAAGYNEKFIVWDLSGGNCHYEITSPVWESRSISCLAALRDGFCVAYGLYASHPHDPDGTLYIWDPIDGRRQELSGHASSVVCVAALSNSRLITATRSMFYYWDLAEGGRCLHTLASPDSIYCLDVLADDRVVSSHDGTLQFWDVVSGRCLQTTSTDCRCVAVLSDSRVCTGTAQHTIMIWRDDNLEDKNILATQLGRQRLCADVVETIAKFF